MLILPLRSTYQLSYLRHQNIHRCNSEIIVIELHVKGFNAFWIINHNGWLGKNLQYVTQ